MTEDAMTPDRAESRKSMSQPLPWDWRDGIMRNYCGPVQAVLMCLRK